MFSGGTHGEVRRWLWNFLASHVKRLDPRIEVELESGDERDGVSYRARFRLDERVTPVIEFGYQEVADRRGSLGWCQALAERTRAIAREHLALVSPAAPR